jgi:hypothetical protein
MSYLTIQNINLEKIKMLFTALLSLAAVAAAVPVEKTTAAQPTGTARILNRCTFDVNYWVNNQGPQVISAGGSWSEPFNPSGSRTITLMTSPRLYSADPKVMMGYTYRPDQSTVYYDLYSGDGTTPFKGSKVQQKSADQGCRANVWNDGVPVSGDHIFGCRSDRDVELELCSK